jgi:hypothetical protein
MTDEDVKTLQSLRDIIREQKEKIKLLEMELKGYKTCPDIEMNRFESENEMIKKGFTYI